MCFTTKLKTTTYKIIIICQRARRLTGRHHFATVLKTIYSTLTYNEPEKILQSFLPRFTGVGIPGNKLTQHLTVLSGFFFTFTTYVLTFVDIPLRWIQDFPLLLLSISTFLNQEAPTDWLKGRFLKIHYVYIIHDLCWISKCARKLPNLDSITK